MTELTPRQFVEAVTRSLKETGKRMTARYRAAPKERAAAQKAAGRKRGKAAGSKSVRRRAQG